MKILAREAALGFPSEEGQIVRRRLTDEHQLDVLLVSEPISHLIFLEIKILPENIHLPDVDVGDILDVELMANDGVLRIKLLSQNYADIFYVLIDDLVDCLISNQGSVEGAKALMLRLRRWEHLLEASSRGLTKFAQKGLFGELTVLVHLLSDSLLESRRVLNSWTGPDGGTRDFGLGETGIEVKTSSVKGLLSVQISSERQLEIVAIDKLFLWSISIEISDKGIDLNKKVQEVEKWLSNDLELLEIFRMKLTSSGYFEVDKHRYTNKFFVRDEFIFRISEGFPRIVSEGIPNGIFEVSYRVDLEACDMWRVAKQDVILEL
jgi:hypothetical protein